MASPLSCPCSEARRLVCGPAQRRLLRTATRAATCAAQNPPEPDQGSRTHRVTTYTGCSAGHPVEWAAFDEGHIAAPQDGTGGDSGSRAWVPAEIWKFFTRF